MWSSDKIRSTFIEFFKSKGHEYVKSSSVIPYNDETLLFTNSGMNQFKPIFLEQTTKGSHMENLKRAVNSQKCIRAGGKHNDLDEVGKDGTHHTFFEMLGNWSFGDYFKEEAIKWSWELLTEVYKLDKTRLYVTYFSGDKETNLEPDYETRDIWLKYLPKERILPFGTKENFWCMESTGPCGPCTEINYDFIGNRDAADLVNTSDPSVIEIWNNVFIQYNRTHDSSLKLLSRKHVDTGMGLERITSILQNVNNNYDTDLFIPILEAIYKETKGQKYSKQLDNPIDTAYRVIADHIRSAVISINDGGTPGYNGVSSVIRSIIRRAIRYGTQYLNAQIGFFSNLVDPVISILGETFDDLNDNKEKIKKIILEEENLFAKTIIKGIKLFNKLRKNTIEGLINGKSICKLYTTYGFPVDMIFSMVSETDLKVNMEQYNEEVQRLKKISQKNENTKIILNLEHYEILKKQNIKVTQNLMYDDSDSQAQIQAIICNNNFIDEIDNNSLVGIILNKTNFYSEKGGQISDTGYLDSEHFKFKVTESQEYFSYVLHIGFLEIGKIKVYDTVKTNIDKERRKLISINHSATHLLNYSLKTILNNNIHQEGSAVNDEYLRFDYNYDEQITNDQLLQIENNIKNEINKEHEVKISFSKFEKIKSDNKIIYNSKECYPEDVRIVNINNSFELCTGTHIENTKIIKDFVIISESSISKGIRRIIAVTEEKANKIRENTKILQDIIKNLEKNIEISSIDDILKIKNNLTDYGVSLFYKNRFSIILNKLYDKIKFKIKINENMTTNKLYDIIEKNINGLYAVIDCSEHQLTKKIIDNIFDKFSKYALILVYIIDNKINISINLSEDLSKKLTASSLITQIISLDGKGGGNRLKSYGKIDDISKIDLIISKANEIANVFNL